MSVSKEDYPLAHGATGSIHFFGSPDATNVVLMSAGFPDDHRAFAPMAKRLAEECGCFVGVICIPGYEYLRDPSTTTNIRDGYSFADWVVGFRNAAKVLRARSSKKAEETKFTGIFHDWGVIAGLQFANQTIEEKDKELAPDQLILFDVLMGYHPKTTNKPKRVKPEPPFQKMWDNARLATYPLFLALGFTLQKFLPRFLMKAYTVYTYLAMRVFQLGPASSDDLVYVKGIFMGSKDGDGGADLDRLNYLSYPYAHVIGAIMAGKIKSILKYTWLPLDLSATPVLFLYGGAKAFHVHNKRTVALLEQEQAEGRKSRAVEVKEGGHWLYISHQEECFKEVQQFLKDA